MQDDDNTHKDQ